MSPLNCTISKDTSQMKTFIIEEKYVGYADVTIHAETEEQAIEIYNEGSYDDNATEYDDMFYDFEFVEIKEESELIEPEPEVF